MSRLFKNIIRFSAVHLALECCPGVEVRVRTENLEKVHDFLTLESGVPIYRPQSIFKQQEQAILIADESEGFDKEVEIHTVRPDLLQAVVKHLISKHYEKRVSAISEIFSIDWYGQTMTVMEISFGRASTK